MSGRRHCSVLRPTRSGCSRCARLGDWMNRSDAVRALLVGFFSLCAATLVPEAKAVEKAVRIGVLGVSTAAEAAPNMGVFRQTLRELGWVGERAIVFEERYADGHFERLPQLAAELVALKVDVILADSGTPGVRAAMKAGSDRLLERRRSGRSRDARSSRRQPARRCGCPRVSSRGRRPCALRDVPPRRRPPFPRS